MRPSLPRPSRAPGIAAAWAALVLLASPGHAQRPEDQPLPPPPPVAAEFRFDFATGPLRDGFVRVAPDATYTAELGYGFDLATEPAAGSPFFFSVKAPEGNYRVTVTLGGTPEESRTTLRAESGRLLAAEIVAPAGQTVTRTFCVNVRRPELPPPPRNAPGGSIVHMFLSGETGSLNWDEKLTLEFNGTRPAVRALTIVKDDSIPTIFVAGDSTVGDPRRGPGGNWPTQMAQFFKPEIAVANAGAGGETSKSFVTGYRLDKVLSQMKPGDFFLVQFGHNDSKPQWPQSYTEPGTTFDAYLRVFVAETRRRGAIPVFVTPMERRQNGDSVGPWARAMRAVAEEDHVPLIDQWALSKRLWTALGDNVNAAFNDQTHLSGYGGYLLARLIVSEIQHRVPDLARFVAADFPPMDPARPAPPPAYLTQSPGPGGTGRGGQPPPAR